ncbi:MAG: 16S rRNA (uracil(1498)-N(3))-methyltransferase [Gammaproteobacteria bacterium]|nr:16S rRNA (uracil(1498)-N(3))-methyltransferase [Gammaproteobacteria bacterium]
MQIPRIYCENNLNIGEELTLNASAVCHVVTVLRLKVEAPVIFFNGKGGEFSAQLTVVEKNRVVAKITNFIARDVESPLKIHLGQAIARGEKMDYVIQKAVELGVNEITPLFSERCNVRLSGERLQKRLQHWRAVIISACEQSGRNYIPVLNDAQNLEGWLQQKQKGLCLMLCHRAEVGLADVSFDEDSSQPITLLIGPEGGLTLDEISLATDHGFLPIKFGPRVLRTETAALSAISALQTRWGDFR